MKNVIKLFLAISIVSFIACTDEKEQSTVKETTVIKEKEPKKSTNVSVGSNGVKVESEKVNVSIDK